MMNHIIRTLYYTLILCLSNNVLAEKPTADRLISIDGALTETVYAINGQANLVAVDTTSLQPVAATKLPNVGYLRALSTEGILSLKPTKIITTSSAGPKPTIDQLKASGIDITIINQPYSTEGVINKVLAVGDAVNQQDNAKQLVKKIEAELVPVMQTIKDNQGEKIVTLFFLGMRGNQLMAAGKSTQADAMMKLAGLNNAGASFNSYKPLSREAVLNINPDMIIISQNNVLDDSIKDTYAYTKAYKNNKILLAKSEDLLGFGPRIASNLKLIVDTAYSH